MSACNTADKCLDDILERPEASILDFRLNRFVAEVRWFAGHVDAV